ncbi:MAG: hypothetical protein ACE5F1_04300 [Planctomycetota bacterium]
MSARIPISAYGKLPFARDFLRSACSSGAGLGFRDFLDDCAPCFIREHPEAWQPLRLTLMLAEARIVASVWSSADEGGLRPYPFALFSILPGPTSAGGWSHFAAVFAGHDRAWARCRELPDTKSFDRMFAEGLPIAALEPLPAEPVPLALWVRSVYGADSESFALLLWRLETLGRRPDGIKLPVAAALPLEAQVDAWLGVLATAGSGPLLPPGVAVSAPQEGRGSVAHNYREVSPADLAVLSETATRTTDIADLTIPRQPRRLDGFGAFHERLQALLARPESRLSDLGRVLSSAEGIEKPCV